MRPDKESQRRIFMLAYPTATVVRASMSGASMLRASVLCASILGLALGASIGTAVAQQPSATAMLTAKELITVKGATTLYEPLVPGVIEQAKSVFLQSNPTLGKELNEVALKLRAEYAARSAEVVNEVARLYAVRFTEQELKDVLAFYKSPLGRKMMTEEPAILEQSMKNAQAWADRLSEEIFNKIRAEMRKRGHDI
jgi:hypothetical protein